MARLIQTATIGPAQITSSTAPEESAPYSATRPYATDEIVYSAATGRVYKSLTGGTPVAVLGNVSLDHLQPDTGWAVTDTPVRFRLGSGGAYPSPINGTTLYYVRTGSGDIKALPGIGEPAVNITTTGTAVVELITNPNYGNPVTEEAHWEDIGPMNGSLMFDLSTLTPTTTTSSTLAVVINPGTRVDTIAALGLENVASIRIVANNGSAFYDQTYSLAETGLSDNWYAGTHNPAWYASRFAAADITPHSGTTLTVTFTKAAGAASMAIGELHTGLSLDIGEAQLGAGVGIDDYSLIEFDEFNDFTITERTYNDDADFELFVPKAKGRAMVRLIASYRARPTLWLMIEDDDSPGGWDAQGIIHGLPRSFRNRITYHEYHLFTLEIRGIS